MKVYPILLMLLLAACDPADRSTAVMTDPVSMTGTEEVDDAQLQTQVHSALMAASDLPGSNFVVQVNDGVVVVNGSLACETCGGYRTPGAAGNVQMSLGAVVRAVPGVQEVHFQLN